MHIVIAVEGFSMFSHDENNSGKKIKGQSEKLTRIDLKGTDKSDKLIAICLLPT